MKLADQKDILFDKIDLISDSNILLIGEKYFNMNNIHDIKSRLYSAVYFGEIDFSKLIKTYNLQNN